MNKKIIFTITILAAALIFLFTSSSSSEEIENSNSVASLENVTVKENAGYVTASTNEISGAAREFSFNFEILENWSVEVVPEVDSLNVYDPSLEGENSLEKSQIFIQFFVANNFQMTEDINILSRIDRHINGRKAVNYLVSKKEGLPDFENQPPWSNKTHKATTIRLSKENPSIFYIFSKNPELSDAEFERFLNAIEFN